MSFPNPDRPKSSLNEAFYKDVRPLEGNLADLAGKRIGIDGNKLIMNTNQAIAEKEPLATMSTSIPYSIYEISGFLGFLSNLKLKLEIVFNGIPIKRDPAAYKDSLREKPKYLLELYGRYDDAVSKLDENRKRGVMSELSASLNEDGEDYLFLLLKMYNSPHTEGNQTGSMMTTRAPYWAWAQLASYLSPKQKYLDEVYGCIELLAFEGVESVITDFNFTTGKYSYYKKDQLLDFVQKRAPSLRFTKQDLPALFAMTSNHKLFNEKLSSDFGRVDFFSRCKEGGKLMDSGAKSSRFLARVVEYCPVLTLKGECVPLSTLFGVEAPPCNELFGERLPSIFYFAVYSGLLNPNVLGPIVTGQVVDNTATVDSQEYREVSEMIIPLRAQILHQLVLKLDEISGQKRERPITWIRRYNSATGRQIPLNQPPPITLDEWRTDDANGGGNPLYFQNVAQYAERACPQAHYKTADSAIAAFLLKSLDLLGYFTHSTSQPDQQDVSGASIYSLAMEKCSTPSLSEYAVLLIELIRTKSLTEAPMRTVPGNKSAYSQMYKQEIVFASRLLSIIPFRPNGPWTGPVSTDLAAFNAIARMLQRSLRALTEVIATSMLVSTRGPNCAISATDFVERVHGSLPFSTPLMCGTGMIVLHIMNEYCRGKPLSMAMLRNNFPDCISIEEDISTIFGFWYFAGLIIQKVNEEEEYRGALEMFNLANMILAPAAYMLSPNFGYLAALNNPTH